MNIFALDFDPVKAARYHSDKHCVKMILESAQLLSTAHHILDGEAAVKGIYRKTHINHPCAIWVRKSVVNYRWLFALFAALIDEYRYRYGKEHACIQLLDLLRSPPVRSPLTKRRTPFALAMPEKCRRGAGVRAYRFYYLSEKRKINVWKRNRPAPSWYRRALEREFVDKGE